MKSYINQQKFVSLQRNSLYMKKILILILLSPLFTTAQNKTLLVKGVSPNLYINHKVEAKENYYSIGRIYNISPKEIAPFNKLELEGGLSLGQVLKIPLNSANFFQGGNADADETFVPVYYEVKEKEGLYRVALNHNDLPLETLKQWNSISGDAISNGAKLIVGYLKVKTELSAFAKNGIGTSIGSKTIVGNKPEEKKITEPEKKAVAIVEAKTIKTEIEKKEPVKIVQEKQIKEDAVNIVTTEKKEAVKPVKETVTAKPEKKASTINTVGGVFKSIYDSQSSDAELEDAEGSAGVFKSTSGWTDKKYYCLHNSATPGAVIKITNPENGKFVFAKVLDLIPDLKQNEGLMLLVSNAAAEELGAADVNFNCNIRYAK